MKLLALLPLAAALSAQAHVTLETPEADAGKPYKAVLRVGHGCDGAPTKQLVVSLPPGLRSAKPMPKAGWALSVTPEAITWTAKTEADWLPDGFYDEFILRAGLPAEPGVLWFKVRQVCAVGEWNWADTTGGKAPAAKLTVRPTAATPSGHSH